MGTETLRLNLTRMRQVAAQNGLTLGQTKTNWCWAASIEMLFAYYGYVVEEEVLVRNLFGEVKNQGATSEQIRSLLNNTFEDLHGRRFQSSAKFVRDFEIGVDPYNIVRTCLEQKWPLLITNINHAMLLIGIDYDDDFDTGGAAGGVLKSYFFDPARGRVRTVSWFEYWDLYDKIVVIVKPLK